MEQLLTTKLYIPPTRPKLVPRPGLIERLNDGLTRKLVLICAPAGFGKTTLLGDWVRQINMPVAWVSLDKGDNELSRFLVYLVAALQTIEDGLCKTVQAMVQSPQPPPIETVLTGLIVYVTFGALTPLGWLSPLGSLAGILMIALHTFFWITLVLMMGTFFESTAGVIAVPMALYFALWFGSGIVPGLVYISPLLLTFSPDETQMKSLANSFMVGEPLFSWLPLISTVLFCAIFIGVAIWRFNRQEF